MNFLKNNFLYVIIFALVLIVFLQRCGDKPVVDNKPKIEIKIDTIYRDTTIYVKLKPSNPKTILDTFWRRDTTKKPPIDTSSNCNSLYQRYLNLGDKFYSKNIQTTEFKHKYGTIKLTDTVTQNTIIGTELVTNLSIPETIKTVTIEKTKDPTRQLYVGGGLYGNPVKPISMAHVGLLYKDKKDRIYQISVGYNGQLQYGVSSFWKLKLK